MLSIYFLPCFDEIREFLPTQMRNQAIEQTDNFFFYFTLENTDHVFTKTKIMLISQKLF